MNATERRFSLIEILLSRRYDTINNLAFELGVSTRTIQRDLLEINTAIPIFTKTGRYHGGVYLIDGFSVHKACFGHDDVQLLHKIKEYLLFYTPNEFSEEDMVMLERILEKCNNSK